MHFKDISDQVDWDETTGSIYSKTADDVKIALAKDHRDLEDFKALISPAALPFLEQMAQLSHRLTLKRFGNTVQLFIPMYLSNVCENHCVYCGFNQANKFKRTILTDEQIMQEVEVLKGYGYDHLLLVSGESPRKVGVDYFKKVIDMLKPHFALISAEVQPLEQDEYETLIEAGLNSVYIYQETYNREKYKDYHIKGKKADYHYRLDTPDRLGKAGIHKIGLGTLIGLEDWRTDAFFTAMHLKYLEKTYWRSKYCISFPRLRPHEGIFQPKFSISDPEFLQLICAYRIFDEEAELSISVRESPEFRDNLIKLGITTMSAGSKTDPGGYASDAHALEQFEVHDDRSPAVIEEMIRRQGYEPVWKDWDSCMQ
jgi:2-iminoacetate synthase